MTIVTTIYEILENFFWSHLGDKKEVHIPKRTSIESAVSEITRSFSEPASQSVTDHPLYISRIL